MKQMFVFKRRFGSICKLAFPNRKPEFMFGLDNGGLVYANITQAIPIGQNRF